MNRDNMKNDKKVHELYLLLHRIKKKYQLRGVKFPRRIRDVGNENQL